MRERIAQGNRGRGWEDTLTPSFQALDCCTIVKTTAPVAIHHFHDNGKRGGAFTGHFTGGGPADYEGGWYGHHFVIEAKSTVEKRWRIYEAFKEHQIHRMQEAFNAGDVVGVLLRLTNGTRCSMYGIAWARIAHWLGCGIASVTDEDLASCAGYGSASGVAAIAWGGVRASRLDLALCVDLKGPLLTMAEFRIPMAPFYATGNDPAVNEVRVRSLQRKLRP